MENLEQKIVEAVHVLPDDKKAEVLEFAENLKGNSETTNGTESKEELSNKNKARLERVMKLSGMGSSKTGDVSQRVDEILAEGINKREGWSLP